MEAGVYLVPQFSTLVPIPSAEGTYKFDGKAWTEVENHIGEVWYKKADGSQVVISEIGPVSSDLTTAVPMENGTWNGLEWEFDLAKAIAAEKAAKMASLSAEYTARLKGPFKVALSSGTAYFALSQLKSVAQAISVFSLVGNTPDGYTISDKDSNEVAATLGDLNEILNSMSGWYVQKEYKAISDAVAAAKSPAAINAVTWGD